MGFRLILRQSAVAGAVLAAAMGFSGPALAHDGEHAEMPPPAGPPAARMDPAARDAWLADCRQRISRRDNGLGGALIGGLVGGVAGNRIAGKHHRTVGTVAGAAVGAVAGMVIDKAEDRGQTRDECDAYLADYEARYSSGYGGYGHGYGQAYPAHGYGGGCCMPMMMVPVMRMPRAEPECTETVEYVYEDVPVRPARRKIVPDKRVKIVPVK